MSKFKSGGGGGDRKGEGISGDTITPRIITPQTSVSSLPPLRPSPVLQPSGHTYIVHSHHEMKNLSKSARPIAPAPPAQVVQNIAARSVQSPQVNISSIISPALSTNSDSLISLNVVTTTASSSLGAVTPSPITVPIAMSQASVHQLGSNTLAGNTSMVQQSFSSPVIPIALLRGSASAGQQAQPQLQAFTSNFSNLPRVAATQAIPKPAGLLHQGTSPALQIPAALNSLSLPIARAPHLQSIKTTTTQATRAQSPAVGQAVVQQTQPQDLSRTSFHVHGSITPVTSANILPISMHVTLNRINAQVSQDNAIAPVRPASAHIQNDSSINIQQRISVTLPTDSNVHPRLTPDIARSTLPFSGLTKPSLDPITKVISAQPGLPLKPVSFAVTTPIMVNSVNATQTVSTTTVISAAPIPIAKVTPQRQIPVGSIPSLPATSPAHVPSSAPSHAASVPLSVSVPHTSMPVFSLPPSSQSLATSLGEADATRHEQAAISSSHTSSGSILIASDFQPRPSGSFITMTTLPSSVQGGSASLVVSQTDNRTSNQNQPQFDMKPGDTMWLQHYVYPAQASLVSQPAQIVRPAANTFAFLPSQAKIQSQTSNLASNQLAAVSVASSPNVRFSTAPMLVMDQLRQQQHPLHSAFSTNTVTVTGTSDKAVANLLSRAVVANSSCYTTSVGVQSQVPGSVGSNSVSAGLSAVPVTNPSSSPRPSILRKRTSEVPASVVRKHNFNLSQESRCQSPPRVDTEVTNLSSPRISVKNLSPVSENSQSSTDTALSSNDAATPTHNHSYKRKGEGDECVENGTSSSASHVNNIPMSPATVNHAGSLSETSPRKRARKQLLHVSEELKDNLSSSEDERKSSIHYHREDSTKDLRHKEKEIRGEYTDEEGVRWVIDKPKPVYVLLQPDFINNKTRNNHFIRYSDVKAKEERWPTVNELSNQRGIMQKVNGWKLYFSASQLEELMENEKNMQEQFSEVQATLSQISAHKIGNEERMKIHEMSQANIQRCQLIQAQLNDARLAMLRTLDHKPRVQEIVSKHMSKRPIKKKERT